MSRKNAKEEGVGRRFTLVALPFIGALVVVGGFAYDIAFAGIPYQDPTPDLQARYTFHRSVAGWMYKSGAILLVGGVVSRPLIRKGN